MSYLDETRFSTYDSNLKEWISFQDSKTIISSIYPWTKTAKAGAVSCYPVGGTELKPVVDFLFTETPPVSGDKGPENPSIITGVSSVKVTRCGKNLVRNLRTGTLRGVIFTVNQDGSITVNRENSDSSSAFYHTTPLKTLKTGLTYSLSGCPSDGSNSTYCQRFGNSTSFLDTGSGVTREILASPEMSHGVIKIDSSYSPDDLVFWPQIELGSEITSFEKSEYEDYTINLNGTYYGGILDVASGVMTVTWHGYAFDGTENWIPSPTHGTYYRYSLSIRPNKNTTDIACTHFIRVNNLDYEVQHYIIFTSGITIFTTQTTVEDFKAWLASQYAGGTPVVACYALATPYTVQLTPQQILSLAQTDKYTPRLNTVYTDASSVQVGYVKSPIREEFELQQAIVAQGGNI